MLILKYHFLYIGKKKIILMRFEGDFYRFKESSMDNIFSFDFGDG